MQIEVNGQSREFGSPMTVEDLLRSLELRGDRVAIELNHRIVRRERWQETPLQDKDRVEIVHFVGGG